MGETENKAAQKESFFSGLSAEFKKIIWPDNKSLARQTAAVVAVSVVMYESCRIYNTSWFPFCPDELSCPLSCCNYDADILCRLM